MVEAEVYRQEFWQRLSPCLRAQLEELAKAKTWRELAEMWGYLHPADVRAYVRGPLRRRLEREGAAEWLKRCVMCDE